MLRIRNGFKTFWIVVFIFSLSPCYLHAQEKEEKLDPQIFYQDFEEFISIIKEIQNKYADQERSEFYMKHCIDEKLYDKITKKYKSKLNIYYNRQLSWFLLDYAPTFCKEL